MKKTSIKPLGARVVVQPISAEEKSSSGIIIPDTASKEKPQKGKVIAVGDGRKTDEGKIIPMHVKVGDTVIFKKYAPTEIEIEKEELYILDEEDILATI